jgi:hypothetical protein
MAHTRTRITLAERLKFFDSPEFSTSSRLFWQARTLFRWVCCRCFGWHTPIAGYTRVWCRMCGKHMRGPDPSLTWLTDAGRAALEQETRR